jgi:Terminase large subunit, T4likevirus-type, N-terminal
VLRWFVRVGDKIVWADRPQDLAEYTAPDENGNHVPIPPKSLTFIPAKLTDNAALMRADPGYIANLMALPLVERERLLGGNWKIRAAAGLLFRRGWCTVVDAIPEGTHFVRGWDLAATPKTEGNDPDWTVGTKIGRMPDGRFIVAHSIRIRGTPAEVERLLKNTASQDGVAVPIALPLDPAQAGKYQMAHLLKHLAGYRARVGRQGDQVRRVLRPGGGRQCGGAARGLE